MYYNLISRMVIIKSDGRQLIFGASGADKNGNYAINGSIQSIEITQSVKDMGDTCKVVIPRNFVKFEGKNIKDLIKEGDKVLVYFGYDQLRLEFTGHIKEVGSSAPLELQIDDEFYPLRKNRNSLSYKSISLKKLLAAIAPGYKIECPDVELGKFLIDRATSYQVLKEINEKYGFYSFIKNGTLFTQFAYDVRGITKKAHTYYLCDEKKDGKKIYGNVRSNNLKYEFKDSTNVMVEVVAQRKNGKNFKYVVGSKLKDASVYKFGLPIGYSDEDAKVFGQKKFESLNFDGFRGSISGFGLVKTEAGDSLELVDFEYPERNGTYLIEKVIKKYDSNGIERDNTLSFKV